MVTLSLKLFIELECKMCVVRCKGSTGSAAPLLHQAAGVQIKDVMKLQAQGPSSCTCDFLELIAVGDGAPAAV